MSVTVSPVALRDRFFDLYGLEPILYRAPGRINLIGEHTDYNDGFVLPCNTALFTWLATHPRSDRQVNIHSVLFGQSARFSLDGIEPGGEAGWVEYAKGVIHVLQSEGFALTGADIVIDGEIPLGGGLSSSASLEAVIAVSMLGCAGLEADAMRVAQMCQRAEHEFAGVPCGIMDQAVITGCPENFAMKLDCRSLQAGFIRLPLDLSILVVDSGVKHQLRDGAYKQRRQECAFAVSVLAARDASVSSLRDATLELIEHCSGELGELPCRRARHVVSENQRVHEAEAAIVRGDLPALGRILDSSHASLRDDFMVSCGEVNFLVDAAGDCPGVYGARMVGGGFGGCAIALVDPDHLEEAEQHIVQSYAEFSGRQPWYHVSRPAAPAARVSPEVSVSRSGFGATSRGQEVSLYRLTNNNGMTVEIINYGGVIRSLTAPDRDGIYQDVVLGYDSLAEYEADAKYFGAAIGRYGNRIAGGRFELDGQSHTLAANNGPNHLHGGDRGFNKVVWEAQPSMERAGPSLLLTYTSVDGEEGYPGKLTVRVRYTLTDSDQVVIRYTANTDQATPVNLTNHSYFNLNGLGGQDILGHRLTINADAFTPVDGGLIPTGERRPVAGTPFDFRRAKAVGAEIDSDDEQIEFGGGYDHNFVINQDPDAETGYVATLTDPESGRVMVVESSEPGVQFYSGNFLDGSSSGKGWVHGRRTGLCLETQHFPDSPNQPGFPGTILRPGETFRSRTVYSFTTDKCANTP
jgi:aldose 1-epimerase